MTQSCDFVGELKNPSKSIPKGTLGATTFALGVYVILTFLTSFTCERFVVANNDIAFKIFNSLYCPKKRYSSYNSWSHL